MKRATQAMSIIVCALLSLSTVYSQEYTLKLNLKEGETYKYKMTMEIDFGGQNVLATTTITNKVLKVEENGNIQIESTPDQMVIKFGDMEMPQPAPPATKATYKPNGSVVKMEGGDSATQQMSTWLISFPDKPIKVGDKWNGTFKNPNGEVKIDYEFVAVEKVGETEALKIKVTSRLETGKEGEGFSSDGFIWIDPKTGMALKMETNFKGLQAEGAPMPMNGTMRMELVK